MDGFLSSSMFYVYIKSIDPNVIINPLFHHKNPKSHGLGDSDIMEQISNQKPSLLIIPDAGSNDEKECKLLRNLGWTILISDHHFSENWNKECVLVNNHMSENVKNKGLCGAGVTWKCLKRYDELYGYNIASNLISYVAFANVSDSMSLVYQENRAFSKWGFKKIHKNLQPFFDEFIKDGVVTNEAISWNVTPKGNALIRMGDLQDKIDFFYALCGEYDVNDIIKRMKHYHETQAKEKKRLIDDVKIIYNGTCILAKIEEKTPLTGLLANMLSGEYLKPILLIHDYDNGQSAGSVRSVVPIKNQLIKSGLFDYNEGHKDYAFGTAYQTSKESDIIEYLDNLSDVQEPCTDVLSSNTIINTPSNLYGLKMAYNELWSKGVPVPEFHIQPFTISNKDIKLLGKNKATIKFHSQGIDFLMFFVSNKMKELLKLDESYCELEVDCVVELGINEWRGNKTNQAIIKKIEIREPKELLFNDIFTLDN